MPETPPQDNGWPCASPVVEAFRRCLISIACELPEAHQRELRRSPHLLNHDALNCAKKQQPQTIAVRFRRSTEESAEANE